VWNLPLIATGVAADPFVTFAHSRFDTEEDLKQGAVSCASELALFRVAAGGRVVRVEPDAF
jgi:hypothetical protein